MSEKENKTLITWQRRGGYECSSKGDKKYSALFAVMPDGRTIEQHYQCDIKGYQPGGLNWKLGKGKPPLNDKVDLWESYLNLWRVWGNLNSELIDDLIEKSKDKGYVLSDCFANSEINQARALSVVCNERILILKNKRTLSSNKEELKEVFIEKKRRRITWN